MTRTCIDLGTEGGKEHKRKGKGYEEEIGGSFNKANKEQNKSKRCLSYRGHIISTCSTVSVTPCKHVGHSFEDTRARLCNDWLSRDRLSRNRDIILAKGGLRQERYKGILISGQDGNVL